MLFYHDHTPLQLHISILPLTKSSSLISCPHCSLSPLFPRAAYRHTVKQEQLCGYQCGVIAHHCSTAPGGQRHQERQIPPRSLCCVAELSRCHGLSQTDIASLSFTWQQKHLPRPVDLGNSCVDGASETSWDVDITGISICSVMLLSLWLWSSYCHPHIYV